MAAVPAVLAGQQYFELKAVACETRQIVQVLDQQTGHLHSDLVSAGPPEELTLPKIFPQLRIALGRIAPKDAPAPSNAGAQRAAAPDAQPDGSLPGELC